MRYLADVHVHRGACAELRRRELDVVHAAEVGLATAGDHRVLEWAIQEDRVVLTRDYADYVHLARVLAKAGKPFPGILFLSPSVRHQDDAGTLVRALLHWDAGHEEGTPLADTYGWLTPSTEAEEGA